jgi:alkylation response protein AidB-like acyl-CoA dehydrogenase
MQKRTIDTSLREDVLARARGVTELLKASGPQIEATRELPPDVLGAMHEARLFRLLLPRSVGGDQIDLETHAMVLETIARADASTAWVMSQGSGCSMAAAFLSPEAAARWFGAPKAVLSWGAGVQGKAVAVDGGYRVTGRWAFNSGSRHATLLGGHSYVFEADGSRRMGPDGQPVDRTMLFDRAKADIDDVWDVVGLRGTGSDTIQVTDLFVPAEDTIDRDSQAECREPGTLYKFSTTLAYGVGFSALMLGLAQSMMDELRELAMTKTPRAATMSLRENPVFQSDLAQFNARCLAARAYLHTTTREVWREVEETGEITIAQRARMKLTTTWVINHCFEVVKDCYRAAGQSAIHPKGPFERRMRDAMTASQQTQGRATNYVTVGRTLLGLEPDSLTYL